MRWWVKVMEENARLLSCSILARGVYRLLKSHLDEQGRLQLYQAGRPAIATVLRCKWEDIAHSVEELVACGAISETISENGISEIMDTEFSEENQSAVNFGNSCPDKRERKRERKRDNKKLPGRPPGDPRHQPFVDAFFDAWLAAKGNKYVVTGRDVAQVTLLLKKLPDTALDEIKARIAKALGEPWFREHGDLCLFCVQWNKYAAPVRLVSGRITTVGFDAETNEHIMSDGTRRRAL